MLLGNHLGIKSESQIKNCLLFQELGALVGGICAGALSDALGSRTVVMSLFTLGLASPALYAVFFIRGEWLSFSLSYFLFGFGSFGPHVLVGLLARELFPDASSTAGTFAKSIAQVGGALAGVPVSWIITSYGWNSVGRVWVLSLWLSAVVFASLEWGIVTPSSEKEKKE